MTPMTTQCSTCPHRYERLITGWMCRYGWCMTHDNDNKARDPLERDPVTMVTQPITTSNLLAGWSRRCDRLFRTGGATTTTTMNLPAPSCAMQAVGGGVYIYYNLIVVPVIYSPPPRSKHEREGSFNLILIYCYCISPMQ